MYVNKVWHKKFGTGNAIHLAKNRSTICFEQYGTKTFELNLWGTVLFTSQQDYELMQNPEADPVTLVQLKEKYKTISTSAKALQENELLSAGKALDASLVFPGLNDHPRRNIMLLLVRPVIKHQKLLRIIGIDIFTSVVVNLVDNEGCALGCHSFDEDLRVLPPYTVIQADFEIVDKSKYTNTLRFTSSYRVLGSGNPQKLEEKYSVCYPALSIINSLSDILLFTRSHIQSTNFFITAAECAEIRIVDKKCQIRLGGGFIPIKSSTFTFNSNEGSFTGLVLLKSISDQKKSCNLYALQLIAASSPNTVKNTFMHYDSHNDWLSDFYEFGIEE